MRYNVWARKSLFQCRHNHKEILVACFDRDQARLTASGVFHCKPEEVTVGYAIKTVYVTERQGS